MRVILGPSSHLHWGSQSDWAPSCWHAIVGGVCSLIIEDLNLETAGLSSTPFESMGVHGTRFLEKLDLLEVGAYKMFVLLPQSSSEKGMEHAINEVFRGENKNFLTYSWHQIFNHDIWSKKMYKLSTLPIYFTHKPTTDWWCAHKGYLFWVQPGNVSIPNASLYLPMGSL